MTLSLLFTAGLVMSLADINLRRREAVNRRDAVNLAGQRGARVCEAHSRIRGEGRRP